jgi:hypothetical protein
MKKTHALAAGVLLTAAGAAAPAATVAVGDPAVDGSFLKPYDNVWRYSVETVADHVDHFQGLWTDHLDAVRKNGRALLRRVQGCILIDGRATSVINEFEAKTLAPVSSESRGPDGSFLHRDFSGAHMSFRSASGPGAKKQTREVDLGSPVYDFAGGMYGLLLAAFPLHEGYRATFLTVKETDTKTTPVTFRVERLEEVDAGCRGKVMAWVVRTGPYTFWLTKERPYVIRLEFVGKKKNIARWRIL